MAERVTMPKIEHCPPQALGLAKSILRDFVLSFELSQGETEDQQRYHFPLLHAHYAAGVYGRLEPRFSRALPALQEAVPKVKMDFPHKRLTAEKWHGELEYRWKALEQDELRHRRPHAIGNAMYNRRLDNVIRGMIRHDAHYMRHRRPDTSHRSLFREYVLHGEPTESSAYEAILRAIPPLCVAQKELGLLVRQFVVHDWPRSRSQEPFYDAKASRYVSQTQTQQVAERLDRLWNV